MTSGVYVYGSNYGTTQGLTMPSSFKELLFYDDGPGATVSVERNQAVLSLKIDGKVDASTGSDMMTQELIAHLPLLMHPRPDTVLVIGLGQRREPRVGRSAIRSSTSTAWSCWRKW